MVASDSGIPVRTATATVLIYIQHTQFLPVFQNLPYTTTIVEDVANGTSIYRVAATDQGLREVMTYGIVGIDPAPRFFGVDSPSGVIRVINSLKADRGLTYTVSIIRGTLSVPVSQGLQICCANLQECRELEHVCSQCLHQK